MRATLRKTTTQSMPHESSEAGVAGWLVMYAFLAAMALSAWAGANLIGDRFIANLPIVMSDPG